MPTEILMPALSRTMEEGTLAKWLVKEGDEVSSGDLLAEIETDKATMEFEAVDEGTIGKILVEEGSEGVKVNTAIAVLLARAKAPMTSAPHLPRLRLRPRPMRRPRRPKRPLPPPQRMTRPRPPHRPGRTASASSPRLSPAGSRRRRGWTLRRSPAPARMAGS